MFVVNGADWVFDRLGEPELRAKIDDVLEFVAVSGRRGERIWTGDDFESRPMLEGRSIWEMAFGQTSISPSPEQSQELAAWLGRPARYTSIPDWPGGADQIEVSIDGGAPAENPDVAWVNHTLRSGHAMACLSLTRRGRLPTATSCGDAAVHFVLYDADRVAFWQEGIVLEGDSEQSLAALASHAYPNIHFVEDVLLHLSNFGGGYLAIRNSVRSALAALNAHGHWIFTTPPPQLTLNDSQPPATGTPSNQLLEHRFRAVGLDAAPENPNVYANNICRRARERVVKGTTLYCEWHVKLEPHRNRIHFHPPIVGTDKVIVGIMHDHLPLP